MQNHDIIVIGASAGGVEALSKLVQQLPVDLPASIFMVLHISPDFPSLLPTILNRIGRLPAHHPYDEDLFQRHHIYIAPPDHHMLIERGTIRIVTGPLENHHRPAIDPLFRSAALEYGPRVIGVILTGALDDGTAGLLSIKQRGGLTIVQDPEDALYPGMPTSALHYVLVDYRSPIAKLGALLTRLVHEPAPDDSPLPSHPHKK